MILDVGFKTLTELIVLELSSKEFHNAIDEGIRKIFQNVVF